MSVPAYLARAARASRRAAGSGGARDPRARTRQVARVRDRRGQPGRRLRASARAPAVTSCSRPTCAASVSGPTGCRATSTSATGTSCAPRWPASSRSSATSGTCNARSTCWARTRSSTPARVAAVGLSYGGTCTLFLAALDDRVRAAVVSGYLSSWRAAHTVPWNMCGSQIMPGQLGALEHLDVAALDRAAPAARRVGHGRRHLPGRRPRGATVAALRRVYAELGAPADAVGHDVFEGEHRWHGAQVPAFLERWL